MVIKQRRVISISKLVICNAFFRPSLFEFWLESRDTSPASWIQTLRWADTDWLTPQNQINPINEPDGARQEEICGTSIIISGSYVVQIISFLFWDCTCFASPWENACKVSLFLSSFFFCSYKDKYESVLRVSRRRSSLSISLPIRYQAKVNCATNVWISLAVIMNVLQFDLIPHRATTLQPSAEMGNICLSQHQNAKPNLQLF